MSAMAFMKTGVSIFAQPFVQAQIKENVKALALVRGIHRWAVNFRHKGRVTRKMFLFDDVIMTWAKRVITDSCNNYATTLLSNRDWNTSRNINITDFDQCYMHSDHANTFWNTWHSVLSSPFSPHPTHTPSTAYMRRWIGTALVQIMACRLFGTKPSSKPMLGHCKLDP